MYVVLVGLILNFNTTFSSSLPSGSIDSLDAAFHVTQSQQVALPVAVFLVGYVVGPLIFGPLSEHFGRKAGLVLAFGLYTVFTLACSLAPTWPTLLVFRFLVGCGASAPQTITGGMYSDIYPDLLHRGRAVTLLGLTSNVGPLIGPVVAGFSSERDWRWMFWISLIMAVVTWPLLWFMPETRNHDLATTTESKPGDRSRLNMTAVTAVNLKKFLVVGLTRPMRMLLEPLVFSTNLFLAYQYAILFLYFEAYPIIFKGTYGMNSGVAACMLLPIGAGAIAAIFIFLWYDRFLENAKSREKQWSKSEEYRRLPLACLGGPMFAISQFWLAWSAKPSVHWSVPAMSGVAYGIGIDLTYLALQNYLTDAYGVYSASALASSVFTRNILAALLLPFATQPLYRHLGTGWACTLLGILCTLLVPIPFVFIRYGQVLRTHSRFLRQLRQLEHVADSHEGPRILENARSNEDGDVDHGLPML
ncbi:MAG: hypothetical protein LQ349_008085 [Xanthoria aureola]|nr:MAG: hypothetical protein LQ349_008085 [Xanthoria aureola]